MPLRDNITDSAEPITLHTANGLTDCTLCVSQQIVGLHETVEPYILDSTPAVLSIGRRCVEDGCAFHWEPYSLAPTMITAKGVVVQLVSRDCCPYLDDHDHLDPHYRAPALAATHGKGTSVRWDPAWLIADAIKTANPDPRYILKRGLNRSEWVHTGPPDAYTWNEEDGYSAREYRTV